MPIDIHGKSYLTVAERLEMLRSDHPDWSVTAQVVFDDGERIVMRAEVADETGRVRGTGHAEEIRGSTMLNRFSALENCETSAWGRALAACSYAGSEVASADELTQALAQQAEHRDSKYSDTEPPLEPRRAVAATALGENEGRLAPLMDLASPSIQKPAHPKERISENRVKFLHGRSSGIADKYHTSKDRIIEDLKLRCGVEHLDHLSFKLFGRSADQPGWIDDFFAAWEAYLIATAPKPVEPEPEPEVSDDIPF